MRWTMGERRVLAREANRSTQIVLHVLLLCQETANGYTVRPSSGRACCKAGPAC